MEFSSGNCMNEMYRSITIIPNKAKRGTSEKSAKRLLKRNSFYEVHNITKLIVIEEWKARNKNNTFRFSL